MKEGLVGGGDIMLVIAVGIAYMFVGSCFLYCLVFFVGGSVY